MKSIKMILLGLVVAALTSLTAADAFAWYRGAYVVARPVYPQVYVAYPTCPPPPPCVYEDGAWAYVRPPYRPWKPWRVYHRPVRHFCR